eukprot:9013395-Ditylum_brightwellii.AAC.1
MILYKEACGKDRTRQTCHVAALTYLLNDIANKTKAKKQMAKQRTKTQEECKRGIWKDKEYGRGIQQDKEYGRGIR